MRIVPNCTNHHSCVFRYHDYRFYSSQVSLTFFTVLIRFHSERAWNNTAWKVSKYWFFSGPYFAAFGLNTVFSSNTGKYLNRKNSVFGHFSRGVRNPYLTVKQKLEKYSWSEVYLTNLHNLFVSHFLKSWVIDFIISS